MLNVVYRLVAPRSIEPAQLELDLSDLVLVRPTHLSICNADQRYYQGSRSEEILKQKLPMALIHEGIGVVVSDATKTYTKGDQVVLLPNKAHEDDLYIAENYLRSSQFCGSGFDGFMQEYVAIEPERLVLLPEGISKNVAAFTELVSVAVHAITRFESVAHDRRDIIGIWGDGNLGFITSLFLHYLYPESRIIVFGRNKYKLNDFTFADDVYLSHEPNDVLIDHAFECCGGDGSAFAIEQIIDHIKPEGTISLMGVSENPVPINTRMVLEKGLRMFGTSRSGRNDFLRTVEIYKAYPEILSYLESLVGQIVPIRSVADISEAFEYDLRKTMGKTIMKWDV